MPRTSYLEWLSGNKRASIHPYLTANITTISKLTGECSTDIIYQQTLAPLFIYYSPKYAKNLIKAFVAGNQSKVIKTCQIPSFREHESLTLKFCPACAIEDVAHYGVNYWHRIHQIPGFEICPKHCTWLHHATLPARGRIYPLLLPPTDRTAVHCNDLCHQFSTYVIETLIRISKPSSPHNTDEYLSLLKHKRYLTENGRIRRKLLSNDFYEFLTLLTYPQQNILPKSAADYRYLSYLLSGNTSQHPFKHLIFSFWLSTKYSSGRIVGDQTIHVLHSSKADIKNKCIKLLLKGLPLSEISNKTSKSHCYLKALAIRKNININSPPRKITSKIKQAIITLANKGFHRKAIAQAYDLSTGSVEMIISTTEGLVAKRKKGKSESKRRCYTAYITKFLRNNPTALIKDVKTHCNAAYYWLYRHEKEWLTNMMPRPTTPSAKPRVDWKQRDIELSSQVKALMQQTNGQLSRTQVDKKLGGHGWLTKRKHLFPVSLNAYINYAT